jgi:hypothetical protein
VLENHSRVHAVTHNIERQKEWKTNFGSGHGDTAAGFLTSCGRQSVARSHLSAQLGALSLRGPAYSQPLRGTACELKAPRENLVLGSSPLASYSRSPFYIILNI